MTIDRWINILASITLIEMMLTIGLGTKVVDLADVARNWNLVLRALLANYVLVPAAAIGLLLLFKATPMVSAGFLIVAVCPGAPYASPFTGLAKGNVSAAVGLMVILAASSALLAPLLLRTLLPVLTGDAALSVKAGRMVVTLMLTQFVPLSAGVLLSRQAPSLSEKLKKPAARLCTGLNLALLGLILWSQSQLLIQIRLVSYLGMLLLVVAALLAGWIFGNAANSGRKTLAITTGVRNVGVALVIVSGSFAGTPAVTATTVYGLFQTIAIALIALAWGRLASSGSPVPELVT